MSSNKEIKVEPIDIKVINQYLLTKDIITSVSKFYPKKTEAAAYKYWERLSKTVEYLNAISDAQDKTIEELSITHLDITKDLVAIKDRCMQAEPVLDKEGNNTGEYRFDASAAIKAIENLAKHIGYFGEHNSQKTPKIDWENIRVGFE